MIFETDFGHGPLCVVFRVFLTICTLCGSLLKKRSILNFGAGLPFSPLLCALRTVVLCNIFIFGYIADWAQPFARALDYLLRHKPLERTEEAKSRCPRSRLLR